MIACLILHNCFHERSQRCSLEMLNPISNTTHAACLSLTGANNTDTNNESDVLATTRYIDHGIGFIRKTMLCH